MKIIAISGSLRKGSFNSALIRELQALAPAGMEIEPVEIGALPLYDNDDEAPFPPEASELKAKIEAADGVIIATPEYNRSIPGVLKNAIDWASRPWGKNSWKGKPTLCMGVSAGKIGTALAQSHLKEVMLYLDAEVLGQPELYLGPATELFEVSADPSKIFVEAPGSLKDDKTKEILSGALVALASKVNRPKNG
jgi:chromate reductase